MMVLGMYAIILLSVAYGFARGIYYDVTVNIQEGRPIKAIFGFIGNVVLWVVVFALVYWVLISIPFIGPLMKELILGLAHNSYGINFLVWFLVFELAISGILLFGKIWSVN